MGVEMVSLNGIVCKSTAISVLWIRLQEIYVLTKKQEDGVGRVCVGESSFSPSNILIQTLGYMVKTQRKTS